MRILEGSWRQVSLGVVDDGTYEAFARGAVLTWPFLHDQWPSISPNFDPDFVDFVRSEFGI